MKNKLHSKAFRNFNEYLEFIKSIENPNLMNEYNKIINEIINSFNDKNSLNNENVLDKINKTEKAITV